MSMNKNKNTKRTLCHCHRVYMSTKGHKESRKRRKIKDPPVTDYIGS